ncbi:MAG: hypothetical protein AAFO80_00855 [Pseudomonadota bacterium]
MPVLTGSPYEASNCDPDTLFFPRLDQTLGQAYDVGLTRLRASERQLLFQVDAGFYSRDPAAQLQPPDVGPDDG